MNINFFILQRILLWCHCCQKMRHIRHNVNHGKPMPRYCVSFQVHSRGLLWCLLMINPGPGINPICFAVNTTEHNCSPIFRSNKTTFLSSNKGNANNVFHVFLWTSTCCQIFIFVYLFYQFYPILHPWLMSPDVAVWLQLVSTMFVHWMSSDRHLWGQL